MLFATSNVVLTMLDLSQMFRQSSYGNSVNVDSKVGISLYKDARFALQFDTANFGVGGHEYWIYAGLETRAALRSATLRIASTCTLYPHF